MVKAQSFFGGTKPKDNATKVRQVGHTGSVQNKSTLSNLHENVHQAASHPVPTTYTRKETVRQVGNSGRAA